MSIRAYQTNVCIYNLLDFVSFFSLAVSEELLHQRIRSAIRTAPRRRSGHAAAPGCGKERGTATTAVDYIIFIFSLAGRWSRHLLGFVSGNSCFLFIDFFFFIMKLI